MAHPIHILWGIPRTTSTAFEWMMRMRGDMACFHEPYGPAWYQGAEAMAPGVTADTPRKDGFTFDEVTARLHEAAEQMPVFVKDFPQYTDHLWTSEWLGSFQHSFLIRDPAKVMTSLQRSYEKSDDGDVAFTDREVGFAEQRTLFERLIRETGETPVVIDSDDVLADPPAMVEAWCDAIGIPFVEDALTWEPGSRSEVLWFDGNDDVWHASLRDSDGLKPQPRKDADISTLSPELRRQYDSALPHYERLHSARLRA